MTDEWQSNSDSTTSRRGFLRGAALASGALASAMPLMASTAREGADDSAPSRRPNVLMICADQFRTDFVGANGANPSVKTPSIDALAARGTNFNHAVCNQPLCSPSRASFMTGVTATKAGVWRLGLELNHSIPSIATVFKEAGYSTNFIGKWHVSKTELADGKKQLGWIPPGPSRGGFDDLWEGSNVTEIVSHPYHGNCWTTDGTNIGFKDEYRVDFTTNRAVKFLGRVNTI